MGLGNRTSCGDGELAGAMRLVRLSSIVVVVALVATACGMSRDRAAPLVEDAVVKMTEQMFPDEDYRFERGPAGGDLGVDCYYMTVFTKVRPVASEEEGRALLNELAAYADREFGEHGEVHDIGGFAYFQAPLEGGTIKVSVIWDSTRVPEAKDVIIQGTTYSCAKEPVGNVEEDRHAPPASGG